MLGALELSVVPGGCGYELLSRGTGNGICDFVSHPEVCPFEVAQIPTHCFLVWSVHSTVLSLQSLDTPAFPLLYHWQPRHPCFPLVEKGSLAVQLFR